VLCYSTDLERSKDEKHSLQKIVRVGCFICSGVRWVQNKEKHADDTSHIVTYYFLAQRIKPVDKADAKAYEKYVRKLTLLHKMLVFSMKTKQTTDLSNVEKLKTLLAEFRNAYFEDSGHKH